MSNDEQKRAAAEAAAELVEDGMKLGLGTGSTVAHLIPALAKRRLASLRCVASSPATEAAALAAGLRVEELERLGGRLDLTIDGADQVAPDGWLVKGGGGAHAREKVLAAAAGRFVVIVSEDKLTDRIAPPVPLEVTTYAWAYVTAALGELFARDGHLSPDGNLIGDCHVPFDDPEHHAARLSALPGIVEHGLFAPSLVSEVLIAGGSGVQSRAIATAR